MNILTENGFKHFDGFIERDIRDDLVKIILSNGEELICTPCHEIMMQDGIYLPAEFICIDDILYNDIIVIDLISDFSGITYDAINVDDTSSFWTNGIISHNCIFLDEFAFVQRADEFYMSTYPVISSGDNTKVIITSTPNGLGNMFYRIWEGAVQGSSEFKPFTITWRDVPGRDEAWRLQTIANTSELQFAQEFSCDFLGSSNTLIASATLLGLTKKDYIEFRNDVKYFHEPEFGHKYIMTVDVSKGRGQDYSTFNVIDATSIPFRQVAVYRSNKVSPLIFPDIIVRTAKLYNEALVIIESNDSGVIVCNSVYHEYEYENTFVESAVKAGGVGVTMTKRVKRIGCSNLKDLIEAGKLIVCDVETIAELSTFETQTNGTYAASGNAHDDLVMNLVLFSWFVSTDIFQDESQINLKELLYAERLKEMDEDMVPFGIIDSGPDNSVDMSKYEALIAAQKEWAL